MLFARACNYLSHLALQKLTDFEESNRALRRLLQDQHTSESEQRRLAEQKSILIDKFARCEEENERLRIQAKVILRLLELDRLKLMQRTTWLEASLVGAKFI